MIIYATKLKYMQIYANIWNYLQLLNVNYCLLSLSNFNEVADSCINV